MSDSDPGVHRLDVAASLWRDFPVTAQPRPLVLTGPTFGLGTSPDDDTLRVVRARSLGIDASVPAGVTDALRAAGLTRADSRDSGVRVTSASTGSMGFSTDRGGRQLPAWYLSISGVDGTCYVMDAESQTLAYPFALSTVIHPVGGYAKVLGDGLTVRVDVEPPWLTKDDDPVSTDVDVLETDAVVVFAPRTGREDSTAWTFSLAAPLGARVLCDVDGSPVIVARRRRLRGAR